MEGGSRPADNLEFLRLTFVFTLEERGTGLAVDDVVEESVLADARPGSRELQVMLNDAAERHGTVQVESVEIEPGSILVQIGIFILGSVNLIGAYGDIRQGFDQLIEDFHRVCEIFLSRFTEHRPRLQVVSWGVRPRPRSIGTPNLLPAKGAERSPLLAYLIASHAVLTLALIGTLIVLLART